MKISPAARTKKMAADMILVAVRDLKSPGTTLESALWFLGKDFGFWAALADIDLVDPLQVFRTQFRPYHAANLLVRLRRTLRGLDDFPEDLGYRRRDILRAYERLKPILEEIKGRAQKKPAAYLRQVGKGGTYAAK